MTLQWKRLSENTLRAEVPEGAYQIEGRSGKYHVWFYTRPNHKENVYVAGHVIRMSWAKEAANNHRSTYNSAQAWAQRAEKSLLEAIEHLEKAINVEPTGGVSTDYVCAAMLAQGVREALKMAEVRRDKQRLALVRD